VPERHLGRQLGRFRIESVLGSGGFAWVYKGHDPELDIPVAIKVLKPQFAGEDSFESRFRREAATAAKLRHPNIIRILAVGRQDEAVFFVMDFLPGSLDQRLKLMGTLPEALLVRLGLDVSAALAFAHREGVIHRDIKTDNILFDEHGNAIVADFGIARAVSGYVEQTGTNMVVGTPQYFSPEQARGGALDGRADIYSLGVTLFRAATGVLPFQGDDWYDIARQHVEDPPPRPRSFNPALSRPIERVLLKCLEKDPAQRYPTGDALHAELVQLLGRASSLDSDATVVMPTPVAAARAIESVAVVGARTWWRGAAAIGVVVAAAAALVLGIARLRGHALETTAPAVRLDARPAVSPVSDSGATAPAPAAGSATADSAPAPVPAASAAAATRTVPPELVVSAPPTARVRIDGRRARPESWRDTSIAPGQHVVTATVDAPSGCPSARDSGTVFVPPSGAAHVSLTPRSCGWLSLDALPAGAHWEVRSAAGPMVRDGTVPARRPIVLPVGSYTLTVAKSYCAEYRASIEIAERRTNHERVRLICGK